MHRKKPSLRVFRVFSACFRDVISPIFTVGCSFVWRTIREQTKNQKLFVRHHEEKARQKQEKRQQQPTHKTRNDTPTPKHKTEQQQNDAFFCSRTPFLYFRVWETVERIGPATANPTQDDCTTNVVHTILPPPIQPTPPTGV